VEQEFDIRVYLNVLRRRYLHFCVPTVVVFLLATATAFSLPKIYHSQATILVESQQIPSDLARSTVTSAAAERIAVLRQRLMTRSNLLEIVREFNLYPGDRERLSPTELVTSMREAAVIEPLNIGNRRRRDKNVIAFTVSFEYRSPETAARVANRFVSLILEQNIRSRTDRASETRKFFEQRVADLEKQLARQEARIVAFKGENEAALPDSLAYRRTLLTELEGRLPEIDQKILTLEAQKKLLSSTADPDAVDATTQEIAQLRLHLKQLRTRYSNRHPSVKRAKNRLDALEKAVSSQSPDRAPPDEFDKTTAETTTFTADVAGKLAAIEQQLTALKEQRAREQARIAALQGTLQKTPEVEIALNVLTREYQGLESQLTQARGKMEEASVGERLEEDRQAERFEVIEQATAPTEPSKPDRKRIVLAGFFVSIAVGVGMVVLFELLDRSIRSALDLQKHLQMRPLAAIPMLYSNDERTARAQKMRLMLSAAAGSLIVVIALAHLFYQPLDLLWLKLLQKVGF